MHTKCSRANNLVREELHNVTVNCKYNITKIHIDRCFFSISRDLFSSLYEFKHSIYFESNDGFLNGFRSSRGLRVHLKRFVYKSHCSKWDAKLELKQKLNKFIAAGDGKSAKVWGGPISVFFLEINLKRNPKGAASLSEHSDESSILDINFSFENLLTEARKTQNDE